MSVLRLFLGKDSLKLDSLFLIVSIVLRPEFAAVTMSLNSISVIVNALLLKGAKI
jgi:cation transport ATPase